MEIYTITKTLSLVLVSALMSSCIIRRETRERILYVLGEEKEERRTKIRYMYIAIH
jgi:hypothetical protein